MNTRGSNTWIMISESELESIKVTLQKILIHVLVLKTPEIATGIQHPCVTAIEFMEAVRIRRTKFDELISENKIKTIKKKRKIYVPVGKIERYFKDPAIQ